MSNATETPAKRGPGRPPKVKAEIPETVVATAPIVGAARTIPDEELENYGGDIAAWDAQGVDKWGNKIPLARRGDYIPGSYGAHMPDLNPPGSVVLIDSPDLKFHWSWWDDDGTKASKAAYTEFRSKGYKPALASDWIVCPELRDIVVPDSTGRLTFGASKDGASVVMYQSEADYRKIRSIITRDSDYVQQTAEEKAAKLQEALEKGGLRGVRVNATVEDDE